MRSYPAATQILTTGALFAGGDLIAQFGIEQKTIRKYDFKRTIQLTAFGTLIAGPAMVQWYRFLNSRFRYDSKIAGVLSRVAMVPIV